MKLDQITRAKYLSKLGLRVEDQDIISEPISRAKRKILNRAFNFSGQGTGSVDPTYGERNVVEIPNSAGNYSINVGTLEVSVKTTDAGSGYRGILVKSNAYGIFTLDGVIIAFDWGAGQARSSGINIEDGLPHYIALTFNSGASSCEIFIDRVSQGTFQFNVANHNTDVYIGNGAGYGGLGQYFDGEIWGARIWNRELDITELGRPFPEGSGLLGEWNLADNIELNGAVKNTGSEGTDGILKGDSLLPDFFVKRTDTSFPVVTEDFEGSKGHHSNIPLSKSCYNFDGTDDKIEVVMAQLTNLYATAFNVDTQLFEDITASVIYNVDRYTITLSGKYYNIKLFEDDNTEITNVYEYSTIPPSLKVWYSTEQKTGDIAFDISGNGNNGVILNHFETNFFYEGTDVPNSIINEFGYGKSAYFSGNDSYVNLGTNVADALSKDADYDIEIELTFRELALSQTLSILTSAISGSDRFYLQLFYGDPNSNKIILHHYNGTAFEQQLETASAISVNTKYKIIITRSGGALSATLNGVAFVTSTLTGSASSNYRAVLGGSNNLTGGSGGRYSKINVHYLIVNGIEYSGANNFTDSTIQNVAFPIPIDNQNSNLDILGFPIAHRGYALPRLRIENVNTLNIVSGSNTYIKSPTSFTGINDSGTTSGTARLAIFFKASLDSNVSKRQILLVSRTSTEGVMIQYNLGKLNMTRFGNGADLLDIECSWKAGDTVLMYYDAPNSIYKVFINGIEVGSVPITNYLFVINTITLEVHGRGLSSSSTTNSLVMSGTSSHLDISLIVTFQDIEITDEVALSMHNNISEYLNVAKKFLSFNEGVGDTTFDLTGNDNDGTFVEYTDPTQWTKTDYAIDYLFQRKMWYHNYFDYNTYLELKTPFTLTATGDRSVKLKFRSLINSVKINLGEHNTGNNELLIQTGSVVIAPGNGTTGQSISPGSLNIQTDYTLEIRRANDVYTLYKNNVQVGTTLNNQFNGIDHILPSIGGKTDTSGEAWFQGILYWIEYIDYDSNITRRIDFTNDGFLENGFAASPFNIKRRAGSYSFMRSLNSTPMHSNVTFFNKLAFIKPKSLSPHHLKEFNLNPNYYLDQPDFVSNDIVTDSSYVFKGKGIIIPNKKEDFSWNFEKRNSIRQVLGLPYEWEEINITPDVSTDCTIQQQEGFVRYVGQTSGLATNEYTTQEYVGFRMSYPDIAGGVHIHLRDASNVAKHGLRFGNSNVEIFVNGSVTDVTAEITSALGVYRGDTVIYECFVENGVIYFEVLNTTTDNKYRIGSYQDTSEGVYKLWTQLQIASTSVYHDIHSILKT